MTLTYNHTDNTAREKATFKKPFYGNYCGGNSNLGFQLAMKYYNERIASLPSYTCHPSCREVFKEDREVVEGKDFEIKECDCISHWCHSKDINYNGSCNIIHPLTQEQEPDKMAKLGTIAYSANNQARRMVNKYCPDDRKDFEYKMINERANWLAENIADKNAPRIVQSDNPTQEQYAQDEFTKSIEGDYVFDSKKFRAIYCGEILIITKREK